ncbi:hypothetical protein S83_048323 [Arachis hypogaea]
MTLSLLPPLLDTSMISFPINKPINHILHFAIVKSGRDDHAKAAFGSDILPVDDNVRRLAGQVIANEDTLLIRSTSPLRG